MSSRINRPVVLRGNKIKRLERVPFGSREYDEDWLQNLIYRQSDLLPCSELDPAFGGMCSLARELPTERGPVDVVLVNKDGRVALVECKLWRNPEARRKVVAQVMDYATAMSKWSTTQFEKALKGAKPAACDTFKDLIDVEAWDVDERHFIDGLSDTLSKGRLLLLVVGDGIREEVQELAETVSSAPHLGLHLALVEVGLYRVESEAGVGDLVVIPEVVTRTREVTRAVVEVRVNEGPVDVAVSVPKEPSPGQVGKRVPLTEADYFDRLKQASGPRYMAISDLVRNVIAGAEDLGVRVQWMEGGPTLKFDEEITGRFFTLGQMNHSGELTALSRFWERVVELNLPMGIYTDYLDEIIALLPEGSAHRETVTSKSGRVIRDEITVDGMSGLAVGNVPLKLLVGKDDDLLSVIKSTISRISSAIEQRPEFREG